MLERKKGKKGSLQDPIVIMAIFIVFAIATLFSFKISTEFNTHVQNDSLTTVFPDEAKVAVQEVVDIYPGILDRASLFLFLGLAAVSLILAALVRVHPVFIPLYWIALLFVIFIGGILSNIYEALAANPNLVAQAAQMNVQGLIVSKLPLWIGIIGHLVLLVMYKIWRNDSG